MTHDPYASYSFLVEGINVASFAEVSGLEVEIETIEYREGNDPTAGVRKLPGLTKFANIVLKRGVTLNFAFVTLDGAIGIQ